MVIQLSILNCYAVMHPSGVSKQTYEMEHKTQLIVLLISILFTNLNIVTIRIQPSYTMLTNLSALF